MADQRNTRVALLILDGWGIGQVPEADAVGKADTPYTDQLLEHYPVSTLTTHGMNVGLPDGQMGNSEVGHLNIGAGRIVYQQLARINKAITDGELAKNATLQKQVRAAVEKGAGIHLLALISDGGVHSHLDHVKALTDIIVAQGAPKVAIHAFLDGRDTSPTSGARYLQELQTHLLGKPAKVATMVGRYYAMDRDKRWDRVKVAYDLLVHGTGTITRNPIASLEESYRQGTTDEFIQPHVIQGEDQIETDTIQHDDLVICVNFRTDRLRELTTVLTQQNMPEYNMQTLNLQYVTMTRYDSTFDDVEVLFENSDLVNTLGEVLSKFGKTQLRIAETEKYPHVTFFFGGGREEPFDGETRLMAPSPKVATYDLQPEMSAPEVTSLAMDHIRQHQPDFICLNYANADMVGHTGSFEAAVTAVETVDNQLSMLVPLLLKHDYEILIIADHGNADYMINEDGSPNTAHTTNPVPCIWVSPHNRSAQLTDGKLADIAPTILHLMSLPMPAEMDGNVLIRS